MKKILYVFDDINYKSGARKVMLHQMSCLSHEYDISAFSFTEPKEIPEMKIGIIGGAYWEKYGFLAQSVREVIGNRSISRRKKCSRIIYAIMLKLRVAQIYGDTGLYRKLKREFETYDIVIVVSEASKLRKMISELRHPRKIQWIHTDYASWSEFSEWTGEITRCDRKLYSRYDAVITLSESSKRGMLDKIPELKEKIMVIPNMIDGSSILEKAEVKPDIIFNNKKINLITVGRLEKEKAFDRILDVCKKLKADGENFCWYIVGEGSLKNYLKTRARSEKLEDFVVFIGARENPFPLMRQSDWLVLLSEYEGTPVTIDEAMVLGLSIMARDVGGIREQLSRGTGGVLLREEKLYDELKENLQIGRKSNPMDYQKYNREVHNKIRRLLEGRGC